MIGAISVRGLAGGSLNAQTKDTTKHSSKKATHAAVKIAASKKASMSQEHEAKGQEMKEHESPAKKHAPTKKSSAHKKS